MNEDIGAGPECYRLIKHWEKAPPLPWPQTAEGGALKAYQCSAGKWTISFGVRWHPDGRPVREGDTITEEQVMPYLEAAMGRVVADVRRVVTLPVNQYQMDALIVWVFNLGIGALKKSTELLPAINSGRWLDAAADMGVFIYATTTAKDGRLWKRAMKGLLIRRYTEATLALGYDPSAAYSYDIALPTEREWQPDWVNPETGQVQGRYYDRVLAGKTKFKDVLRVAQRYPLPESTVATHAQVPAPLPYIEAPSAVNLDSPLAREATIDGIPVQLPLPEIEYEDTPAAPLATDAKGTEPAQATQPSVQAPSPISVSESAPAKPSNSTQAPMSKPATGEVAAAPPSRSEVTPLPPKLPDPPIPIGQQTSAVDATRKSEDWSDSAKSMIYSRRFWGLSLVVVGRLWMLKTGSNAVLGAVSDPIVTEMFSGFMVMMIGEIVQHWGKQKATRPLK